MLDLTLNKLYISLHIHNRVSILCVRTCNLVCGAVELGHAVNLTETHALSRLKAVRAAVHARHHAGVLLDRTAHNTRHIMPQVTEYCSHCGC